MKFRSYLIVTSACLAVGIGALTIRAEDSAAPSVEPDPAAAQTELMAKITEAQPRIERLKSFVGQWKVEQKMYIAGPDAPPIELTGTEKVTMLGEYWLLSEFESEMMGQPYHGRATVGYDVVKGHYVMYWVDTMAPYGMFFNGTYDEETGTFSYEYETKDIWAGTGLDTVFTITQRPQDDGILEWRMTSNSALGEMLIMEATYTRVEEEQE